MLIRWDATLAAIEATSYVCVVIASDRIRPQQARDDNRSNTAVVIVSAVEVDEHVLVPSVVADALNHAATANGLTLERLEVHHAAILNQYRFRLHRCSKGQPSE